jgi:hypothetical protein
VLVLLLEATGPGGVGGGVPPSAGHRAARGAGAAIGGEATGTDGVAVASEHRLPGRLLVILLKLKLLEEKIRARTHECMSLRG